MMVLGFCGWTWFELAFAWQGRGARQRRFACAVFHIPGPPNVCKIMAFLGCFKWFLGCFKWFWAIILHTLGGPGISH